MVSVLNCILYPIVLYVQSTALPLIKNNNNSRNRGSDLVNRTARLPWQSTHRKNSPGFFSFFCLWDPPRKFHKAIKNSTETRCEDRMKKATFSENCQALSAHREQPRTLLSPGISAELTSAGGAVLSLCSRANLPLQAPGATGAQSCPALRATYNTLEDSK